MSKQASILAIALAAVVAGLLGWTLRGHPQPPASVPATPGVDKMAQPLVSVSPHLPARVPLSRSRPDPRGLMLGNAQGVSKQVASARQKLQSRFAGEPVNAAWAASTEQALEQAKGGDQIDQLGAQPLAFAVQCRTSVCLIGADFPSITAADDWFTLYSLQAGSELASSTAHKSRNPDGTIHLEIYGLSRGSNR